MRIELNYSRIRTRFIGHLFTLNLVAGTVCYFLVKKANLSEFVGLLPFAFTFLLYVFLSYFFLSRLAANRQFPQSVRLEAEELIVPRLWFPSRPKRIPLSEIDSTHITGSGNSAILVIGRKNRYPVILEQGLCKQTNDLWKLSDHISDHLDNSSQSPIRLNLQENFSSLLKQEFALVALMAALLAAYIWTHDSLGSDLPNALLLTGGNSARVIGESEYYRVFSSFFLHFDANHLLANFAALACFGHFLARAIGGIRALNLVFITSVAAVFTSNFFLGDDISIGASGGVFGLIGAYLVLKTLHKDHLPALLNPMPGLMFALLIAIQIFAGYFHEFIDQYNHSGGFLAGALLMYLFGSDKEEVFSPPSALEKTVCIGMAALYASGFAAFALST